MATKIVKKVARKKKVPKKEISDTEMTKSIIEDFILNCEKDGITIQVLKKLHAAWLPKLKESIPDLYQSINTEWNKILQRRKEIKQLSLKLEKDRQSSKKENLDVIGNEFKRITRSSSKLTNNKNIVKIGLSMPLLDDEMDVSRTFDRLSVPIAKNVGTIFCSTEKALKCSVKNGNLALNVDHNFNKTALNDKRIFAHISNNDQLEQNEKLFQEDSDVKDFSQKNFSLLNQNELKTKFQDVSNFDCFKSKEERNHKYTPKNVDTMLQSDWKYKFDENPSQTTSDSPKSDSYLQFVKHAGLDHLIYRKKYDDQTFKNEKFHYDIDDFQDYKSSFYTSEESAHHIQIKEDLPMLSLKRKHSIKQCQRKRRKTVDKEKKGVINQMCYEVISEARFSSKGFNLHYVAFLPNQDQEKEQRIYMLTVPSLLMENLNLIISPLIKKVNKFTESEATFVLQKSVDSAMKQMIVSQMDGPLSTKFRMVHNDEFHPLTEKFLLTKINSDHTMSDDDESIDSNDNISDEDDIIIENNLNAECENSIYCCYKKIFKRTRMFYIKLYNGIIRINGKEDRYFKTLEGKVKFQ